MIRVLVAFAHQTAPNAVPPGLMVLVPALQFVADGVCQGAAENPLAVIIQSEENASACAVDSADQTSVQHQNAAV